LTNPVSNPPRLVVAGLSGDSGKTLVSLGLLLEAAARGIDVRGFKKGPDYIDAAWLTWASGYPARNLDTYLMGFDRPLWSFAANAATGWNVVEGNRGLFDGSDARGTHSTAELAKLLRAPVVLVVAATKVTRTVAAHVLGCQKMDPEADIAGVVLNRVATARQERVIREAVEAVCGVPVLGAIPRLKDAKLLPGRHLGLVTPAEHPEAEQTRRNLLDLVRGNVDVDRCLEISQRAPSLPQTPAPQSDLPDGSGLRIGYLSDSAFTFYYPENLEALEEAGASLVPVSALSASRLPERLDALYIGGGFPETHGPKLAANTGFLGSLHKAACGGLPVYAECGGLMLLARAIRWRGDIHPMSAVLPFDVEVEARPQGHGYADLTVDRPNGFFREETRLRGHEFHYSRIVPEEEPPPTACAVDRGTGCYQGREGVLIRNVFASYTHLHALATPEWAEGLVAAARRYHDSTKNDE